MNLHRSSLLAALFASPVLVAAQGPAVCPTNAVFLAITDYNTSISQVRGYPTRANGPTVPCQVLAGSNTTFSTVNGVAISIHGYLHVLQFLTNGTVAVFPPNANGNVSPDRIESTETNDLLAIATDASVNDFVLSRRSGPAAITVFQAGTTLPAASFNAPGFDLAGGALAIDSQNNLIVGGYFATTVGSDQVFNPLIETLGTNASIKNPTVVRKLSGPKTGLLPGSSADYSNDQLSTAVDPFNGELYVYNYDYATQRRQISVFASGASGNVAPVRVISGALTQIGPPGELNNKIAVSADGRLFVAEANDRILVFAPGASGNVPPAQVIQDATIGAGAVAQGGIGVRSCSCN
jgi:hypothetical protein